MCSTACKQAEYPRGRSRGSSTDPKRRGMKDCWGKCYHIMRLAKLIASRARRKAQRSCANAVDEHNFIGALEMRPETHIPARRPAKLDRRHVRIRPKMAEGRRFTDDRGTQHAEAAFQSKKADVSNGATG